jgi:hypothetical protein
MPRPPRTRTRALLTIELIAATAGHLGRSSHMRGLPALTRLRRLCPVRDERGMERSRRSFAPDAPRKDDLQGNYGSDGTRTRDLRRDRPSRAQRRPATNSCEWSHLQVLFALRPPRLRMVEPIVASTFGPRVGHEMLSGVTTNHTPLRVADVHRASSLELLLTMSSDRQLVLTRHDLHQLLAKTDTRPDHTPRRLTRPNTCANTCARIGRTRSLFPRAG